MTANNLTLPPPSDANSNKAFWRRLVMIGKLYWLSSDKWKALGMLALVIGLVWGVNKLNVKISFIANDWETAMQGKDVSGFYVLCFAYMKMFVIGIFVVTLHSFFRSKLALSWRTWMTKDFLALYMANRAFFNINMLNNVDNPDERITNDVDSFTTQALSWLLAILGAGVTLYSFLTILYNLAPVYVFEGFVIFGMTIPGFTVSHGLFWAAIIYPLCFGTPMTLLIGRKLPYLNFLQRKKEANVRFDLINVRANAESIALYQGEKLEYKHILRSFLDTVKNYNLIIGWSRNLGFFTNGFNYMVVLIPSIIMAPLYFADTIKYGAIGQADTAFSEILGALTLIVGAFDGLASFIAVTNRLGGFYEIIHKKPESTQESTIQTVPGNNLRLEHVTLLTPDRRLTIVKDLSVEMVLGEGTVIVGPSGSGKSSVVRAIAGLWNQGEGRLVQPDLKTMLFLPQKAYMTLGTLREQLLFPYPDSSFSDLQLKQALDRVGLSNIYAREGGLDAECQWSNVLSPGQQQLLSFARVYLHRPQFLVMDESTSALDVTNEKLMYEMIKDRGTSFVSVGHRPGILKHHKHVLLLNGDTTWRLMSIEEYLQIRDDLP
ncbi:MAG: ABC transporter ATP-binding protein/permease [Candidatus Obscuribacterales bacterium]|nr:ABC transporter ATP-binding protein/permease [Candidatus Obscuribacterales bacterium]